jgi:hypothetical protein
MVGTPLNRDAGPLLFNRCRQTWVAVDHRQFRSTELPLG